jgi:hypothetical protein
MLESETRGGELIGQLAARLTGGRLSAKLTCRELRVDPLLPIGTIVGARRLTKAGLHVPDLVELQVVVTRPGDDHDPFVPRWRVHRVRNIQELIDKFSYLARPMTALARELGELRLPDGEHSSIIQAGLSDWQFLRRTLRQCRILAPGSPAWLPLTLIGGVDEQSGSAGHWVIAAGSADAYRDWGDIPKRCVRLGATDGTPRLEFASVAAESTAPFPEGAVPIVVQCRDSRPFEAATWQAWRSADLPRFWSDDAMLWRIEDVLRRNEARPDSDAATIIWDSRCHLAPPGLSISNLEGWPADPSWIGTGEVTMSPANSPWLTVKLSGFESGEDTVDARIMTAFSGHDGTRGLHLVPATGTTVALGWAGRFDASVSLLGNTRSKDTAFAAPSLYLEDAYSAQFTDVAIKRIGHVTVDSALAVSVDARTTLKSSGPLQVTADGADLALRSGVVYTGRGV